MKPVTLFIIMAVVSAYFSCEKNSNINDYQFEAEVLGRNTDCGLFAIKFTGNLNKVMAISESSVSQDIYIAKNLSPELQIQGQTILLNIRKPSSSELSVCTDLGPGYPWIYVTNAKLK
jgi:hypothetical protein